MRRSARAIVVTIPAMLSCVALGVASALTAGVTLAATQGFLVPGTGTPNASAVDGYIQNAQDYYMTPFTSCTVANDCEVHGINYPAQFWPVPLPGWGGISAPAFDESVGTGVEALNNALTLWYQTDQSEDKIVVFGYSQGARVVSLSKEYFASNLFDAALKERLEYVFIGNISRPNGGIWSRLSLFGYVPILDVTYGHATPTDLGPDCTDGMAQCTTTDIALEYDGVGDFPNYLFNVLSVLNAVAGIEFVHPTYLDPNEGAPHRVPDGYLPGQGYTPEQLDDLLNDPANQQRFGDTLYILIPTPVLPIVQPALILRQSLPFLSPVIDPFVEFISPILRWEIDNGYDRSINPGVPTQMKLFRLPFLDYDPFQEIGEFIAAVQEGFSDAFDGVAPSWVTSASTTSTLLPTGSGSGVATPTEEQAPTSEDQPVVPRSESAARKPAAEPAPASDNDGSSEADLEDLVIAETTADDALPVVEAAQPTDMTSGNKVSPDISKLADDTPSVTGGTDDVAMAEGAVTETGTGPSTDTGRSTGTSPSTASVSSTGESGAAT